MSGPLPDTLKALERRVAPLGPAARKMLDLRAGRALALTVREVRETRAAAIEEIAQGRVRPSMVRPEDEKPHETT